MTKEWALPFYNRILVEAQEDCREAMPLHHKDNDKGGRGYDAVFGGEEKRGRAVADDTG